MKRRNIVTLGIGLIALVFLAASVVALYSLIAGPDIGPVTKVCTMMGCSDSLQIHLIGDLPEHYTVRLTGNLGYATAIDCPGGDQYPEVKCWEDGAIFMYNPHSIPKRLTITVVWEDHVKSETVRPAYSPYRPSGPGCEPECLKGEVTIELP